MNSHFFSPSAATDTQVTAPVTHPLCSGFATLQPPINLPILFFSLYSVTAVMNRTGYHCFYTAPISLLKTSDR